MELFDSHAHYNDEKFNEDRWEIIKNIYKKENVTKIVTVGYNIESSKSAIEISKKIDYIYCTIGISPNDIPDSIEEWCEELKELENIFNIEKKFNNKKIIAIGEIGLDYYWNKENKNLQKKFFIDQIKLANRLNLPIVIHTRDAYVDTIDILKNNIPLRRGVFHCCPQNIELIKAALNLGFYISFAGPITFKNSKNAREICKMVPLEKLLIETDSPYLSPEPNRGKRNDSSNLKYIAKKIAEFKEISVEDVAEATYNNANKIFGIFS